MLRVIRAVVQYASSVALVVLGVVGAVATNRAFLACDDWDRAVGPGEACLHAKDHPDHLELLSTLWLVAFCLTLASAVIARGRAARWVAIVPLVLVLVFNLYLEYGFWLATDPWTADWAPGSGYSMAGSWLLAGLLTAVSATLALRHQPTTTSIPNEDLEPAQVR